MRSRMDNPCDLLVFGRPPPPPPFSAMPSSLTSSPFPIFTFTPTPSVGISTHAQSQPPFTSGAYQTLGMSQPISMPSFGFHDSGVQCPRQHGLRIIIRNMTVLSTRAAIVGSPEYLAPAHGGCFVILGSTEANNHVRFVSTPRFDGTEVNNWIRGIQFYFDHVGTPEAERLHYVIMLF